LQVQDKNLIFVLVEKKFWLWGKKHVASFSGLSVKETTARQKREEKKFGEYVCVRTRQSGD
jgi:hypothetical protein